MEMSKIKEKLNKLPTAPGVYIFRDEAGKILYIGKATNLRNRVASYFRGTETRNHIEAMMPKVADIKFFQTDSVLEALILESNLIKKHQPKYNIDLKDDKSFSYFVVTKEKFPRITILRATDLDFKNLKAKSYPPRLAEMTAHRREAGNLKAVFGPYTSKKQMEIALKIIRKIFPFHSNRQETEKGCLDFQIGLCPGPYAGAISEKDYQKNIHGIRMILEGKKKSLVKKLEKEMQALAKKHEFEKAADLRNKVFALN
ncbi:MAG TPA: GIY-YIG nuclease family protein, partial [Candidatus Moranbacteria bacterium]|nr:GIY-YIG nuclease family protein [Candidatus Moranbacteria bacterium]